MNASPPRLCPADRPVETTTALPGPGRGDARARAVAAYPETLE